MKNSGQMKKLIKYISDLALLISLGFTQTLQATESTNNEEQTAIATPKIYLRKGQRYPLDGIIAEKFSIEPNKIASAHQTPEGILLIANESGTAKLKIETHGKKASIDVLVRDEELTATPTSETSGNKNIKSELEQILTSLQKKQGLELTSVGNKFLLQGEVLNRNLYQKALSLAKHYPQQFILLAHTHPAIKASLIEQAQNQLISRGLKNVKINYAGNRFFLEGQVNTPELVDQAIEITQTVLPNIENHLPIPVKIDPTVSIHIFILELSRQAHETLGLGWPSSVQQIVNINPFASPTVLFSPIWTAQLKHFSGKGQAKILAEPTLAVKNGSSAELSAGGEIPIKITGRYENKVIWKHYGLKIFVKISSINGHHIRTKIETESSQLDEANSVDGVPGVKSNKMSTEIDAVEGKPILLTGLFQSGASKDIDKLPILGNIPILGELFKSRNFREHESELLVAFLPEFGAQETKLPLKSLNGLNFDLGWRPLD